MVTPILWSIDETARQLGGISGRTVQRMLDRGELDKVRIGRCVRVKASSVQAYVEARTDSYNDIGKRDVQRGHTCHTNAKILQFGGQASPTRAGKELDALLEPQTEKKRKPLKRNGK